MGAIMTNKSGLSTVKPTSILKKSITLDFKEFSVALSKAGADFALGKWDDLTENGLDVLKTLGLKTGSQEIAWLLIYRSLLRAMKHLVKEKPESNAAKLSPKALQVNINKALEHTSLAIGRDFLERPGTNPIFELIKPPFTIWLKNSGLSSAEAEAMSDRLPIYFAKALHEEWSSHPKDYATLKRTLDTPLTQADKRTRAWLHYSVCLQHQVDEPMFGEAFSLRQVYVPLLGYYDRKPIKQSGDELEEETKHHKPIEKVVVDLASTLETWLLDAPKDDAIRFISGSPGSGKSSVVKIFAAKLAEEGSIPVLFIPLHHLEMQSDLIHAVGEFFKFDQSLPYNPLEADYMPSRLLIIFDGLDELAKRGKIAKKTPQDFVEEVQSKVELFNQQETRVQVLICSRELLVQAHVNRFCLVGQILHILPYFVPENIRKGYSDPQNLLGHDRRNTWWQNYGKVTGSDYTGLPTELDRQALTEITALPLLSYLAALSLRRKEVNFSQETNPNLVYADLIKSIYEQGWSGRDQSTAMKGFEEKDFGRILEEIALATWHGDGRAITAKKITSHCHNRSLGSLLTRFQTGLQEDPQTTSVTSLLATFSVRQSRDDEFKKKIFQFTHKNFEVYLTSKRILREIRLIHKKLTDHANDSDEGWDDRDALQRWAMLCGLSSMDQYLFDFIQNEVRLRYLANPLEIAAWQQTFCHLIEFAMHHGMPMERIRPRPDFQEEDRQAINAGNSLLAVLGIFADLTKTISKINFRTPDAFGELLTRLQGQRTTIATPVFFYGLRYLDLSKCILEGRDFYKANLEGTNFEESNLKGANLEQVNLERVNLERVNLRGAILKGAILKGAIFIKANLEGANLEGAMLRGANLAGAMLREGNLEGVNLEGGILRDANLVRANLGKVNLMRANLVLADLTLANLAGAQLGGANFGGTILRDANLAGANLEGAIFRGANLDRANLEGAILRGAILRGANFKGANFRGANLEGANFEGAILRGANLEGANLKGATLKGTNLEGVNIRGTILEGRVI